jgi:transcriptional regulator with XRE-family HTH domain
MAKVSKSKAMRAIEAVTGGPLTFGEMIWSIREGEEMSLAQFAKPLGVSRQHLNDIEKGQRSVSVTRAAEWAEILGYPVAQFVRLALQAQLDAGGLVGLQVEVTGKLRKAG